MFAHLISAGAADGAYTKAIVAQTLAFRIGTEALFNGALPVTLAALTKLKQRGADRDLLATLRQALGDAEDMTVALGD